MRRSPSNPPRLALWILRSVFSDQGRQAHLADFQEEFETIRDRRGPAAARAWFRMQTLKSLPGFVRNRLYWGASLLRNALVVTWRGLVKNKWFSLINLAGLAIGLAGFILILTYIRFETSFDRFHEKSDRIFRVLALAEGRAGGAPEYSDELFDPRVEAALAQAPDVVRTTHLSRVFTDQVILKNGEASAVFSGWYADEEFFQVFSFPLIRGDRAKALSAPDSIVLTDRAARSLFGSKDPIGQILRVSSDDAELDLAVTGIVADVPANSHLRFSFLISLATLRNSMPGNFDQASNGILTTYAELSRPARRSAVEARLRALAARGSGEAKIHPPSLQPLTDIHLRSAILGQRESNNGIQVVRLFAAIALVLLLIAVVNYVNLTTSRTSERAREIGVRRTMGASTGQLFGQFITEAMAMAGWAAVLALAVVRVVWPGFKKLIGIDLDFRAVGNPGMLALIGAAALATGFLAGLYPAAGLARLRPVRSFREFARAGRKGAALRSVLVVFQFGASIVLIVGTIVIGRQMGYVQSRNPGYNRERVVVLPIRQAEMRSLAATLRRDFLANPDVIGATVSSALPTDFGGGVRFSLVTEAGETTQLRCVAPPVDEHFLDFYVIGIVQGRNYRPGERNVALVNETLVRTMGWKNPLDKTLDFLGRIHLRVVGVVRDFHYSSMHTRIGPLILWPLQGARGEFLSVRVRPGDFSNMRAGFKRIFENRIKGEPFDARFLDDIFDGLYRKEARTGTFVLVFAFLAVFLSGLGLSGLSAHAVASRTKEIGVRRVLGASRSRLLAYLNGKLIVPVLLANALALPTALWAMNGWLRGFAYRIELGPWILLQASGLAWAVGLLTVSLQTARAVRRNPADALRCE